MDTIFLDYEGQVASLAYHMSWPSSADPFYQYNTTEGMDRRSYYGINSVPDWRYDGKAFLTPWDTGPWTGQPNELEIWGNYVRGVYDSLLAIPSPLRLEVDHHRDGDSAYVSIDVIAEDSADYNMTLYAAIKETWVRVPGSGTFYRIFRNFMDGSSGVTIAPMVPGDSLHFEYTYSIDDSVYWHGTPLLNDRIVDVVWVQRNGTKKIQQSWEELLPMIDTDVVVGAVPPALALDQNMPNPFNPMTTINYHIDRQSRVQISVYAPNGRLVTNLVNGQRIAGSHTVTWDGTDNSGREVGSGVYYYRLDTDKNTITKKMVLIR